MLYLDIIGPEYAVVAGKTMATHRIHASIFMCVSEHALFLLETQLNFAV